MKVLYRISINLCKLVDRLVKDRNVETVGNAKVIAISNNSVTYEKDGQTYVIACDTIIMLSKHALKTSYKGF